MIISFTASQQGITSYQREHVRKLLEFHKPVHVVHGGCIGGDDACDLEAASSGILRIIHPADIPHKTQWPAEFKRRGICIIYDPAPPLARNKTIVHSGSVLVACPAQSYEVLRSGTWMTIRYARKVGMPLILIPPTQ